MAQNSDEIYSSVLRFVLWHLEEVLVLPASWSMSLSIILPFSLQHLIRIPHHLGGWAGKKSDTYNF